MYWVVGVYEMSALLDFSALPKSAKKGLGDNTIQQIEFWWDKVLSWCPRYEQISDLQECEVMTLHTIVHC